MGSVLNSNSYNASAMMGNRFRSILSSIRGAFNGLGRSLNFRRANTSGTSTGGQNKLTKFTLVENSDPRYSQIKSISNDTSLPKTINMDGVKIVTYNSDGNYYVEVLKNNKVVLKKVRRDNGNVVTEWLSKGNGKVEKRETKTPNKIITNF